MILVVRWMAAILFLNGDGGTTGCVVVVVWICWCWRWWWYVGIINAKSCNWINAKILRYLVLLTNERYELIGAADGSNWKTDYCCMIVWLDEVCTGSVVDCWIFFAEVVQVECRRVVVVFSITSGKELVTHNSKREKKRGKRGNTCLHFSYFSLHIHFTV